MSGGDAAQPGGAGFASVRLPYPPIWADRPPAVRAAERRARKAYFAALDALHSGGVNEDAVGKLVRLVEDIRSDTANRTLRHLLRVFGYVRRRARGRPVVAPASVPLTHVTLGIPAGDWLPDPSALEGRFAWTLDWLRMRRYVAGKGATITWCPMAEAAPLLRAGDRRADRAA